jgi:hypothetical protein
MILVNPRSRAVASVGKMNLLYTRTYTLQTFFLHIAEYKNNSKRGGVANSLLRFAYFMMALPLNFSLLGGNENTLKKERHLNRKTKEYRSPRSETVTNTQPSECHIFYPPYFSLQTTFNMFR